MKLFTLSTKDFFSLPGKSLLVLLFSSLSFANVFGITKTFTGPGDFSDATKWNSGILPSAGDDLNISGICTIDNNGATDNVAYGTLTIGNGSVGTLNWVTGGTNKLNVSSISSS